MIASRFAAACLVTAALGVTLHGQGVSPEAVPGYHVIPFDADPPISIDGQLDDWSDIPNRIEVRGKDHVVHGGAKWTGPEDLSAVLRLAWLSSGLCIAAEVTDDIVLQSESGPNLYRGDHLEIFLDFLPGTDRGRKKFGRGQCHVGLSPGSFGTTGTAKTVPEIVVWRPTVAPGLYGQIAARRTPRGYVLEAFVPFKPLGGPVVQQNRNARFEIVVSDTDVPREPLAQDTLMTRMKAKWVWPPSRTRLSPVVFGDADGKGQEPVHVIPLAGTTTVERGKALTIALDAPIVPDGKVAHLFFKARIDRKQPKGYRHSTMVAEINGKRLPGRRLSNRPALGQIPGGANLVFVQHNGLLMVPYTPSGAATAASKRYRILDGSMPDEFEFSMAGLLKPGRNEIVLRNLLKPNTPHSYPVVVSDVSLVVKAEVKPVTYRPAPTGTLPVRVPKMSFPKTYFELAHTPGEIRFKLKDRPYTVESRFSSSPGKWISDSTALYEHERRVIEHNEWIEVHDTFTNRTDRDVPLLQTHSCNLGEQAKGLWMGGQKYATRIAANKEANNPTIYAAGPHGGIGLVPLDDVFRIHCHLEAPESGAIRLADREFYLAAGKRHTVEWAIVPTVASDFWGFINATRRLMDANFTLKYQFAFLLDRVRPNSWSDKRLRQFVQCKSLDIVCRGLLFDQKYNGHYGAHGLAFETLTPHFKTYFTDFRARLDRVLPDRKLWMADYFHCYLDVMPENGERFKECRNVDAAGRHRTYGNKYDYLNCYVPTLDNAWGKAIAHGIDLRLDTPGVDALYWDEFNASGSAYTYNMEDGFSADINPETLAIDRRKGSVHLLSRDWLVVQAKRIMARVPLVLNGPPQSRTIAALHIQNFVETASIANCRRALLSSPIALGDHLSEETAQDSYRNMVLALDWGCLSNWYHDRIEPTHQTLAEHMFPFTPIELHSGYVIGEERIVTNRSGLFGWDDKSEMTIHVYDREGMPTDQTATKVMLRDGRTYAEIRIPEGFSAAIVRDAR
ncbi:MAG: hypothetical protein KAI66_03670 [Lentisphaeria bacterium]|nr:hypothetical protein [Lentisphaeria bacterium]